MESKEFGLVDGSPVYQTLAVFDREIGTGIVAEFPVRVLKGDDLASCRIGRNDEAIAARYFKREVTWRVTGSVERPYAGDHIVARFNHDNAVLDRTEIPLGAPTENVKRFRMFLEEIWIHPEIPLRRSDKVGRIGKLQTAIVRDSRSRVIRMRVREDNLRNRPFIEAGGSQISKESAV